MNPNRNPMYGNRYDLPFNPANRYDYSMSGPPLTADIVTNHQIYNDNIYPDDYNNSYNNKPDDYQYNSPNGGSQSYSRSAPSYVNTEQKYNNDRYVNTEPKYNNDRYENAPRNRSNDPSYADSNFQDSKSYSNSGDTDYRDREREIDRERERDRDRSNRRNRDDKRRSDRSDRSRDRDRDRDRSRERDRNRDRDRYDRDRRSQSPSYDVDSDRYGRDERSTDKWMVEKPTNTILLRGLPSNIEESYITKKVMASGIPPREVRLMRRNAGASRGFAFVEFTNVEDAQQWMEINQGQITLMDILVTLHYSTPRNASPVSFPPTRCDWICKKCGVHNFRRRDVCFKCGLSREDSDRVKTGEGFDEVGLNPCNTLVFRGLDALTTEETLLQTISKHTLLPIKNVCIMRDKATSTSRGYGFAEMNSVSDSSALLEVLTAPTKPPFEVDGKQILVAFAKNTFTTVMATQNQYSAALPPSESKSSYYPSSSNTQHDYSYYNPQSSNTGASTVAVAQAAIQQAHAAQLSHKLDVGSSAVATNWSQNSTTDYPKYPPPDVSTYQYDESSGYYYDPLTNLYYDANTQYYYNSHTAQFMYWDSSSSTYLPAPTDGQDNGNKEKDPADKKDKVKIAKKVAKDMEKWAKTLNTKKDSKKVTGNPMSGYNNSKESATADAGFAMFSKKAEDKKLMPPPPVFGAGGNTETSPSTETGKSLLVASYGGDSDEEEDEQETNEADESKLLDWSKLACLLCKRQFQSKEILTKHIQFSDLHKQNLEKWRTDSNPSQVTVEQTHQYRDRAKERREKFGAGHPESNNKSKKQSLK
ncbi:RNA-binding protein 5 isoform X3 [Patella vulgata]|uniref:RNA-binding protein 5 isoform X3 n=1 Tax=Patella vulgata TaxID=6465 RepID=UPI00217F9C0C|nr:RNA-binding protein 5 isoform X3 [Patella vulgata]